MKTLHSITYGGKDMERGTTEAAPYGSYSYCVHVCVRACVHACMRACVHECVHACMCVRVWVCMQLAVDISHYLNMLLICFNFK